MQVCQNKNNFSQNYINQLKLENLDLSDIFKTTKRLTKEISIQEKNQPNLQQKKTILKKILQYIVSTIEKKNKLDTKNFISHFSILSYINVALTNIPLHVEFSSDFYENFHYYTSRIVDQWENIRQPSFRALLKTNLSTLLCSISSVIVQSKKNILNLKIDRLLTGQTIKNLLKVQYPNQQKFMKHYKILINYLYISGSKIGNLPNQQTANKQNKQKLGGLLKQIFIKSMIYHFINCPILRSTQLTIAYILLKQFQDKKLSNKFPQIFFQSKMVLLDLIKMCFVIVQEVQEEKISQQKLILQFLTKATQKLALVTLQQLKGEQFTKIIEHIYNKNNKIRQNMQDRIRVQAQQNFPDRLEGCFQQILVRMSEKERMNISSQILEKINLKKELNSLQIIAQNENGKKQYTLSIIDLQIIQISTKKINEQFIIYILECGFWQQLINLFKKQANLSFKKFLITKIVNNILQNSKMNQDVYTILKNLYGFNQIFCYAGNFQ